MTKKTGNPRGRPPTNPATIINKAVAAAVQEAVKPALRPKMRYDAGGQGRRMAGWNPAKTSPNTAIAQLPTIRERARDSSRNDWAAGSLVQKWSTSLVGIGITPRWKRIKSKKRREEVIDLYQAFVKVSDADGVLDLYGQQTMVVRTWFDGGECFARKRRRFPDAGYPVPMQVQLLESDMCPMLDTDARQGLPVGNTIRSGIEFDKRGQRVAYWFYKSHPGDKFQNYNGEEIVRVAASEVCHVFEPKRPGQIRGVSEAVNILARLRNAADYEDATLERQKLANLFVAFLKKAIPTYDPSADASDPLTGEPIDAGTVGSAIVGMQPGLFQTLEEGESMEFSNPPEAGTNYSEYLRTTHLGTAAGGGLPYELMSGDIKDVSDRTLRVVINEFRRLAEQRQWQVLIPMFCQRVIEWFAESAFIVGAVSETELPDLIRVEHAPHGWPHIHPTQDVEGQANEVKNGFRSQSSVISMRGDDPDQVAEEQAADEARMKSLKIGPYSEAAQQALAPDPAPAPSPAPAPAPTPAPAPQASATALDALVELVQALRVEVSQLRAGTQA